MEQYVRSPQIINASIDERACAACLPVPTYRSSFGSHFLRALLSEASLEDMPDLRAIDHPDKILTKDGWVSAKLRSNGADKKTEHIGPESQHVDIHYRPAEDKARPHKLIAENTELAGEASEEVHVGPPIGLPKSLGICVEEALYRPQVQASEQPTTLVHAKERLTTLVQKSGDGGSSLSSTALICLLVAVCVDM